MATQYIDPQVIFASDAPTQDKPPAFNNYIKGMDETRSNDGRPTIKQFNFIQQQNDFKFLYIHERGACLPFVEGFPYENNAVVFKDGFIQQKNGSSWIIPFMRGSQNLAELTDVAQARTKLDVYAKSEALSKANNLSELADKATARTNLDVYSKTETDIIAGTPNATTAVAGKAKIATTEIAQAGENDTDFITAKKLHDVVFSGGRLKLRLNVDTTTTPPTIRGSFNVLSVTQIELGRLRINYLNPMDSIGYTCVVTSATWAGSTQARESYEGDQASSVNVGRTVNSIIVSCGSSGLSNTKSLNVLIFE